jgi:hypothetical protein
MIWKDILITLTFIKSEETKDPNVDIELDRPDVLGEFDRGFSDIDLY